MPVRQTGRREATQRCGPKRSGWRTKVFDGRWRSTAGHRMRCAAQPMPQPERTGSREETEFLKALAAAEPDNAAVRVELSHALSTLGNAEEAIAAAKEAARIDPARAEPLEQLASIFADVGDAMQLTPIANELVTRFPTRDEGHYYQAAALFLAGRAIEAERPIRTLLSANPRHAKGQNMLGAVCASLGNHECALAAFTAALELDPRDPSVYVNLAYLRVERGDVAAAARFFSEALAIDTTSEAARQRPRGRSCAMRSRCTGGSVERFQIVDDLLQLLVAQLRFREGRHPAWHHRAERYPAPGNSSIGREQASVLYRCDLLDRDTDCRSLRRRLALASRAACGGRAACCDGRPRDQRTCQYRSERADEEKSSHFPGYSTCFPYTPPCWPVFLTALPSRNSTSRSFSLGEIFIEVCFPVSQSTTDPSDG